MTRKLPNLKQFFPTLTGLLIIALGVVFFNLHELAGTTFAAGECPPGMSDADCLKYLQDQGNEINKKKNGVKSKIDAENASQSSLNSQIAFYQAKIEETELTIQEKENLIAQKETEIKILTEEIIKTQQKIDELSDEIEDSEGKVQLQARESYKSRFRSPLEAILNATDFTSMMRRLKYLQSLRDQFKEILVALEENRITEQEAREELKAQKTEVEKLKAEIEAEKASLEKERDDLDAEKAQYAYLLAQSQKTEAEYAAEYAALKKKAHENDVKISLVILRLFQSGQIKADTPVKKGDIVGFQGHTGWAYGSHLHFGVIKNGAYTNPYNGFIGNSGGYVVAGSIGVPMPGTVAITQGYHSGHNGTDLVNRSYGNQTGDKYYAAPGSIKCDPGHSGYHSLRGEGAPIYATSDGYVTKSKTDYCGGKYVLVDHKNGVQTIYLHLR